MSRLIKPRLRSLLWQRRRGIFSPFELVVLPLEFFDVALPSLHLGVDLDGPQSKFFIFESETRTGQRIFSFRHTQARAFSFPVFQGSLVSIIYDARRADHIILENR